MKKLLDLLLFPLLFLLVMVSCSKEKDTPFDRPSGRKVTFTVRTAETKTALGEKDGNSRPVLWSAGDRIAVNGVESDALEASQAGSATAEFTVAGVSAPYKVVSPASALSAYADGSATVTIPSEQAYSEGSFDPEAYVMLASATDEMINFAPAVALFSITPTGEGGQSITSVRLMSKGGVSLSGAFSTEWNGLIAGDGTVPSVRMADPDGVELGKPWVLAIAPADLTQDGLEVVITDADGGVMTRSATPTKAYEAGKLYTTTIPYSPDFTGNIYGTVTCGGSPMEGVLVSDGIDIVETDSNGHYAIQSEKKWENVFVIIPSGYEVPKDGVMPRHYQPLTEAASIPEQVDFELTPTGSDTYRLLILGDMHLARRTGDLDQFAKVSRFMDEFIDSAPGKVYGLTLGDLAWDMYWVSNNFGLPEYVATMNEAFGSKEFPVFHTMGNHDNEMECSGDLDKARRYIHTVAPTYYSFNLGQVHVIVLDDMDFTGVPSGQSHRSEYHRNLTPDEIEWLRKDLSYVDKSHPVIVTAHETLALPDGLGWKDELNGADIDISTFLDIFSGYNVRMITGHTHSIFNRRHNSSFVEHNYGAVCGTWWWSGYLTPGIHIGQEGSPGGFGVFEIDGTDITHYYQAAGQSRDYQFRAYDMNKVKEFLTEDYAGGHPDWTKYYNYIQNFDDNVIFLNVWDWDEDWNVEIEENGTPLTVTRVGGAYDPLHIAAFTGPRLKISSASDSPSFQTRKWNHFFKATASSATSTVTVKVTDRYGNVFTEEMTRPKVFSIDDYKNEVNYTRPEAEFVAGTSSSVIFGWTVGGTAAEDADMPYKLELFRDAACSDLVVSYDVPSGSSCWDGQRLRFVFGGLQPATHYWFKVTNTQSGDVSDPVEGQTEAFTVVDPATVTNAGVGDVVLAEDFSEVAWGPDEEHIAAGFFPSQKLLEPVTGSGDHSGSFVPYNSTARRVYGDTKVTSDKRLYHWGFFGNSAVYAYNGHLRVCTTASGARTHIVSPALSGIPEGKTATVDVTVTACPTYSSNDVAVFVNDHTSLTLALAPDKSESTNPKFSSQGGKYTGASLTNGYPLDASTKRLEPKTVRIEGVNSNSCLIIGSYENVDTKNRFWLSDVKVQIVALEETPDIIASHVSGTSSSLVFSWTAGVSASDDVSRAYTATLYKDSACNVVDQSFDFPADLGAWNGKQPRYVFGGLQPSTDYWFKVKDTTNNLESNAVKATTEAFTVVEMPESITETGIVLAEDFGELRWEFDLLSTAAGFRPSDNSSFANTGVKTSENNSGSYIYGGYHRSGGGGELTFKGQDNAIKNSRLKNWLSDTNVYIHPGYFKLGTSSSRGWILTPEFTVPVDKKAIVSVTISAARINSSQDTDWAIVVLTPDLAKANPSAHTAAFDWPDDTDATVYQEVSISSTSTWETKTVSGLVVNPGDRIAFGGRHGGDSKKGRCQISDIIVTVTALEDANRTTKVSILGDSISTFNGWCDKSNIPSGKSTTMYYPKSDGDVLEVSDTWWYKVIYNKMVHGTFEKNISAGNTTVVQNTTGDSSLYWYGWDFGTRLQAQGLGDPDVVFIYGGTNDLGHLEYNDTSEELIDGVEMNASSFPDASQSRLEELYAAASAATTVSEADDLDGTTFCSAYIRLLQMIKVRHPAAKVVCIIGDYLYYGQGQAISRIAELFGDDYVRVVDILSKYGYKANSAIPKYAYAHPTKAGMSKIADEVALEVLDWIDE